jgi:hypothetical protein
LGRQAGERQEYIADQARGLLDRAMLERTPDVVRLDVANWASTSPVVTVEAIRELWRLADWPLRDMTERHWRRIDRLVRNGGRATFPGAIDLQVIGRLARLRRSPPATSSDETSNA